MWTTRDRTFGPPPSSLAGDRDGDVIRHEPTEFFLDPAKVLRAPAKAERITARTPCP
jgi:hypothetical protein